MSDEPEVDIDTACVEILENGNRTVVVVSLLSEGVGPSVYLSPEEAKNLGTAIIEAACLAASFYKEGLN